MWFKLKKYGIPLILKIFKTLIETKTERWVKSYDFIIIIERKNANFSKEYDKAVVFEVGVVILLNTSELK